MRCVWKWSSYHPNMFHHYIYLNTLIHCFIPCDQLTSRLQSVHLGPLRPPGCLVIALFRRPNHDVKLDPNHIAPATKLFYSTSIKPRNMLCSLSAFQSAGADRKIFLVLQERTNSCYTILIEQLCLLFIRHRFMTSNVLCSSKNICNWVLLL